MKKKSALTLIEIMIVILIITMIGSVVGYNMKGSLEKGKVFRTKEGISRIYEIVHLKLAEGVVTLDELLDFETLKKELKNSGLIKKVEKIMRDGWGMEYRIEKKDNDIRIRSDRLSSYIQKNGLKEEDYYPWEEDSSEML